MLDGDCGGITRPARAVFDRGAGKRETRRMRHLAFVSVTDARPSLAAAGVALLAASALWLAALPAAAQNANTDEIRAQYARAIDYCNSVGWRFQTCVDTRRVVEDSCANNVVGYCDLADRIVLGSGSGSFPNRGASGGASGGATVITPDPPPVGTTTPPAGTTPTPIIPVEPASTAGAPDGRNFDDVLQGLTDR